MRKRQVSQLRIGLAAVITLIIFFFGLLLGNYVTEQKIQRIQEIEENLRIQTAGAELQYLLVLQEPCRHINSTPLTEELYRISEHVDYMESQRGETNADVRRLKNTYSILQLRHWLFTLRTNEQCQLNQVPVMYFYSNQGDCPRCQEQGYILTYLRKKYPDLRVYAFDINTVNPALDTIKSTNQVTETPTVVLPRHRFSFVSLTEIETLLTTEYNLTAQA